MKTNLILPFITLCACILAASCVKDTDFDQEVVATPIVELNLIFFDLEAGEFFDDETNNEILTLRDTTEIRFLDDTTIQESLLRAEFLFRFTNSIPRDFVVDFQFLSEESDTTYVTQTPVAMGSVDVPVVTEFIENVEGEAITQLTMANRVVVSVTIPSSDADLLGVLNLQSKTTYYLEITDRE